jgi:hypothetical protein
MLRRARVKRTRQGTYRLELPPEERQVIGSLLGQLRQLLSSEEVTDDRLRRLFPPAYADDAEADEEYQRLMRDELVASRMAAVEAVERSIDASVLDAEQVTAWMAALNAVRLVLGTMLDLSEDFDLGALGPDDPDVESYVLYSYLSMLLEEMVRASGS